MQATGSDIERKIWNFLRCRGLSPAGAAGLMGNLYAESALNPMNLQNSFEKKLGMKDVEYVAAVDSGAYGNFVRDSAGFGLAQWTYWTRKEALLNYAKKVGTSIGDLEMQLNFLFQELKGYAAVHEVLRTARTVQEASNIVLTKYERPADQSAAVKAKRASYGQAYYDYYTTNTSTGEEDAMNMRQKVVEIAQSWIGKNEKDGSHRSIIDLYNSHTPLARGYKVKYTDAWCATMVSAVAIAAGCTDVMPTECGCGQMIKLYQNIGRWKEDDSYVPNPGDIVFYDWDDTGTGDDTGWPEHVGIVEACDGKTITVIEGNYSDSVKRRYLEVNGRYIRGFGLPDLGDVEREPMKSSDEIAKEVIAGKWGDGEDRKKKLREAGYDPITIQALVNQMYKKPEPAVMTYKVGYVYTVQASDLNVRTGPGTGYKKKTHSQLTRDGQKHDKNKNGALDKGTQVTCQDIKVVGRAVWIKVPSGWICACDGDKVYLK